MCDTLTLPPLHLYLRTLLYRRHSLLEAGTSQQATAPDTLTPAVQVRGPKGAMYASGLAGGVWQEQGPPQAADADVSPLACLHWACGPYMRELEEYARAAMSGPPGLLGGYLGMLHVVAGCVAGHVAGRSGWPSLALAVGVAVAELECLLRQLALSEYDGKARAVAQAMRSPNKACIAELAQQLQVSVDESCMLTYAHVCSRMLTYAHVCGRMGQGVDRLRIDRAEGNFLNVLLTDALWPKYHGWIASFLDNIIESFVEGFGVTIDDKTRTVLVQRVN